jgi:hypothetical protein
VLGAAETAVGLTASFKPLLDHRGLYVPNLTWPSRSGLDFVPRLWLAALGTAR